VPRVSEFYGIAVYVYYREHMPPHFHALYGGDEVEVSIESLTVLAGRLPPRAMGLVVEWATLRRRELLQAWERAVAHQPPGRIEPLR